ncbi:MAG: EamA family transporter, partial [Devosia sp.]
MPTDAAAAPDVAPDDTPAPAVKSKDRRLLGVILVIAATMLFAINDATNKHLLATYDVPLIAAVRYIGQTLWILALLGPSQGRKLVKTQRTFLVIVRSLCLVVASLFFGLALQRMPLAETTSIVYLAPI